MSNVPAPLPGLEASLFELYYPVVDNDIVKYPKNYIKLLELQKDGAPK